MKKLIDRFYDMVAGVAGMEWPHRDLSVKSKSK